MTGTLKPAALRWIIKKRESVTGIDDAVSAFAKQVPVASRTVNYWLAGRKMHSVFEVRVLALAAEAE